MKEENLINWREIMEKEKKVAKDRKIGLSLQRSSSNEDSQCTISVGSFSSSETSIADLEAPHQFHQWMVLGK